MGFREAGKESRNMVVDGEPVVDPRAGRFKTQFTKAGPGKAEIEGRRDQGLDPGFNLQLFGLTGREAQHLFILPVRPLWAPLFFQEF